MLLGLAPLLALAEATQAPIQAVVDEAGGEIQQEVAFHGGDGALDVEAVVEDALEDGLADEVVVVGPGGDTRRAGAKSLEAGAPRRILCVEDVNPDDRLVADGADVAIEAALEVAAFATSGAGIARGSAADGDDLIARFGLIAHGLRSWVDGGDIPSS